MSANIKASVDGTQAIIGVGGVDQMTVNNAGIVTANSFVGLNSSSVTATGSTTARTLANRFADVVNVLDFGAKGDGTDDTPYIQAAIDYVNTQGGGAVYFPQPISFYGCTQTFTVGSNTALVGDESRPALKWTSAPNPTRGYPSGPESGRRGLINKSYSGGNENISIESLKLDFSLIVGAISYARQVIYFYNCNRVIVKNCNIISDGGAICNVNTRNYIIDGNYCEQAGTYSSSDGVIDQWDGSKNGVIQNNFLDGNGISTWSILATASASGGGSSASGAIENIIISNNFIKNCGKGAIEIQGRKDGTNNIEISGNKIYGDVVATLTARRAGIIISGTNNTNILNNFIIGCYGYGIFITKETASPAYPFIENNNLNIFGNIIENCANGINSPIEFRDTTCNQVNFISNIVKSTIAPIYNYSLAFAGTSYLNINNYNFSNNYLQVGTLAVTNDPNIFDITFKGNDGITAATIRSSVNSSNNSVKLSFFDNGFNFVNSANISSFLVSTSSTAVNRVQVEASNTNVPVSIIAAGTDTNIDLAISPKGTGKVRIGTYVNTPSAVTGYIEIKDASGTLRKLAVLA